MTPVSPRLLSALIFGAAFGEAALTLVEGNPLGTGLSVLAAVGLLWRRRAPWISVALALPGLVFGCASISAVVAMYALAVRSVPRWLLALAVGATFTANAAGALNTPAPLHPVAVLTTAAMFALAPAAIGALVATRRRLVLSLAELREYQSEQARQAAGVAVRNEREVLAREMHDVVSHQVSLMAVQAGALQVRATDGAVRDGARTIRELCVATLEELRTMLGVLRSGDRSAPDTAPQPSLAELPALAAASELDVCVDVQLPETLSAPVQRAVFRTVQESLTNARKHAPGAAVTVVGRVHEGMVDVRVRNTAAVAPALTLPGSGLGILGLSERAHVLGGSVRAAGTADGGFETRVLLPLR